MRQQQPLNAVCGTLRRLYSCVYKGSYITQEASSNRKLGRLRVFVFLAVVRNLKPYPLHLLQSLILYIAFTVYMMCSQIVLWSWIRGYFFDSSSKTKLITILHHGHQWDLNLRRSPSLSAFWVVCRQNRRLIAPLCWLSVALASSRTTANNILRVYTHGALLVAFYVPMHCIRGRVFYTLQSQERTRL
jgi:hypothetical protein